MGWRSAKFPSLKSLTKAGILRLADWHIHRLDLIGNTMGSVVSDGELVYAVTVPCAVSISMASGVATDLKLCRLRASHYNIQSPMLAGDLLIYNDHGAPEMVAVDKRNGKVQWRVPASFHTGEATEAAWQ